MNIYHERIFRKALLMPFRAVMQLMNIWQRLSYRQCETINFRQMRNLKTITKAGIIALSMTLIFSANVNAKGTSEKEDISPAQKEQMKIDKLIAEIQEDSLDILSAELEEEGVLNCSNRTMIKILDAAGEVVYEGSYVGMSITNKELKNQVDRADFLVTIDDTNYYMVF